jgi:hypothetical protein
MNDITPNPKYTKSYKTRDNLNKALSKLSETSRFRYSEYWFPADSPAAGRVTAILYPRSSEDMMKNLSSGFMQVS